MTSTTTHPGQLDQPAGQHSLHQRRPQAEGSRLFDHVFDSTPRRTPLTSGNRTCGQRLAAVDGGAVASRQGSDSRRIPSTPRRRHHELHDRLHRERRRVHHQVVVLRRRRVAAVEVPHVGLPGPVVGLHLPAHLVGRTAPSARWPPPAAAPAGRPAARAARPGGRRSTSAPARPSTTPPAPSAISPSTRSVCSRYARASGSDDGRQHPAHGIGHRAQRGDQPPQPAHDGLVVRLGLRHRHPQPARPPAPRSPGRGTAARAARPPPARSRRRRPRRPPTRSRRP